MECDKDKMVGLSDRIVTLYYEKVIKGQDRTLVSLIICVASLMYYLDAEISPYNVFILTLGFAAIHLFGIFIVTRQWFHALLEYWGALLLPLVGSFKSIGMGYVVYFIISTRGECANWRLLLFLLSYAVFHFLLMINEIGGTDFSLTTSFLGAAFIPIIRVQQQNAFGALMVLLVSATLFVFQQCHIERTSLQYKAIVSDEPSCPPPKPKSVMKPQPVVAVGSSKK